MFKCKSLLCLLLAALMTLTSLSTAFCAAAEDSDVPTQTAPLTVQVEMSKPAYFVTARAKAIIRVENTGTQTIDHVFVELYSDKHRIPVPESDRFPVLLPVLNSLFSFVSFTELEPGETAETTFDMVLDNSAPGLSFFERALLFLAQLIGSRFFATRYIGMAPLSPADDDTITQEISFRHGSADATLQIRADYQIKTKPVEPES